MRLRYSRHIAFGLLSAIASCALLAAQQPIRKPVQPSKFVGAIGQRAAILGREDGTFEAWLYPIKILRDFRISVYVDGALEPQPLAELAETVTALPGSVTITHAHAAFTVRQTFVASMPDPVLAVLLDVETSRSLKFRASFIPEMKPMWPASFGGQSTDWDEKAGVLTFTEGLQRFNPVIGCPRFSRISEQIGHQLPDRTVSIEFELSPEEARRGPVAIVIAADRASYDRAAPAAARLSEAARAYYEAFERRTLSIQMAPRLAEPFAWAKVSMDKGWACNEIPAGGATPPDRRATLTCGLVAGWGASGLSERPGFGWYFGGDALMNLWGILDYGDFERARGVLDFLLQHQRADGKIPHELTQSLGLLDWSKYPYGYYHGDTTPLLLYSASRYVRRSGDTRWLSDNWPKLERAFAVSRSAIDTDGLLLNRKAGAAAVETGALSGKVLKDIYLQGVWIAALGGYRDMARWLGKEEPAREAETMRSHALEAIQSWYVPGKGHFAFAQLKDGTRYEANSGWQAFLLAFSGLVDPKLAGDATKALSRPELATNWGTRLFATDSPFYNALGYNDGSVWPFVTDFVALAEFRNGRPEDGFLRILGMADATGLSGAGLLAENFSGDRFQTLPHAVPHQLFSSLAMIHPVVSGMLGLDGDALAGTLNLSPRVPRSLGPVRFERYRVGSRLVSGEIVRNADSVRVRVKVEGEPLRIVCNSGLESKTLDAAASAEFVLRTEPDSGAALPAQFLPGDVSSWPRKP